MVCPGSSRQESPEGCAAKSIVRTRLILFLVAVTLVNIQTVHSQTAAPNKQGQSGPTGAMPISLQQKLQHLHEVIERRQEEGSGAGPVAELMQKVRSLIEQHKFPEAEALVDHALKLLGAGPSRDEQAESEGTSLLAFGVGDADGREQIFVANSDGTGKVLLPQKGKRNCCPAWSPDGKRIAYTSDEGGTPQVWVMSADGSDPRQLTSQGANVNPVWSPDGTRLAFASTRTGCLEIWLMAVDGSQQQQLTQTPAVSTGERLAKSVAMELHPWGVDLTTAGGISNNFPSWSPHGRQIAFCSTRGGSYAIWSMDAEGHHLSQITNRYGDSYPDSRSPAWSPDGVRIAFWSGKVSDGFGNIWAINADGTNPTRLTNLLPGLKCHDPAWSADGEQIVFSVVGNARGQIAVIDADGQNQKTLISNIALAPGRIAWQPLAPVH